MKDFFAYGIVTLIALSIGFHLGKNSTVPTQAPHAPPVATTAPERQITLDDLLDAIELTESGGDANAVGDGGKAVGSFQIHKIYVDDVNRISHLIAEKYDTAFTPYKYHWRNDPEICRIMVSRYIKHYATMKRIGRIPRPEDMARIHNGGPNGWKKESTKAYWLRVKEKLQ